MHSRGNPNTYVYVFSEDTQDWKGRHGEKVRGAVTGDDLPYILGVPLLADAARNPLYGANFMREEQGVSQAMMRYISNFVKSG